jgi:hypothetical protein
MRIEAQLRLGLLPVQLAAIPWSLLCLELADAGHRPSAPSPFSDPYAIQALALPLLLGLQWLLTWLLVFSRCVMRGLQIDAGRMAQHLGACLGLPILLAFVLPDYIAYRTGGFETMAAITPATGLLCLLLIGLSGVYVIKKEAAIPRLEALKILATSLLIASLPVLILVR